LQREKITALYKDVFDFIKRVNQRTVNKKSIESLANSGAFDCFPEHHRAQYFFAHTNDNVTGIERIIRFGNLFQSNKLSGTNNLFGDSILPEIAPPFLPKCNEWTLTEKLEREKKLPAFSSAAIR
jgi:DNA polymerase-3 subunit alpha